jgi:hypothetical protein
MTTTHAFPAAIDPIRCALLIMTKPPGRTL